MDKRLELLKEGRKFRFRGDYCIDLVKEVGIRISKGGVVYRILHESEIDKTLYIIWNHRDTGEWFLSTS